MADALKEQLKRELVEAGFSRASVDAAWPTWWLEEVGDSSSGRAELRFSLSRRLGLSPSSLIEDRVEHFWDDSARFKHLRIHDASEQSIISSFGIALGRELIRATPHTADLNWRELGALDIRASILNRHAFVDLSTLVATCWSFGIPVIHLNVVPLENKSMHAMVVTHHGRFAILLARNTRYPAQAAFTLAHELGHILSGHLGNIAALVDLEDPAEANDEDEEEREADNFALNLLTGTTEPVIETDRADFNAPTLAAAARAAGQENQVEPGTIALALAYRDGSWARTMSALGFIYGDIPRPSEYVNGVASHQLKWELVSKEAADYIGKVMAAPNG